MRQLVALVTITTMIGWADSSVAADYATRYVNGTQFIVGAEGDLQVWVAAWRGPEFQTMIYVVNGSDNAITFYPDSIRVEALKHGRDGVRTRVLKTFSAADYESVVRKRGSNAQMLATLGAWAARPNAPQGDTYVTKGRSESRNAYGARIGSTSYSGTITRQPTAEDASRQQVRESARAEALKARLDASFQSIAQNLMRTQTLDASTYYGGMVYSKKDGEEYAVTVPFGDKSFQFRFTFAN